MHWKLYYKSNDKLSSIIFLIGFIFFLCFCCSTSSFHAFFFAACWHEETENQLLVLLSHVNKIFETVSQTVDANKKKKIKQHFIQMLIFHQKWCIKKIIQLITNKVVITIKKCLLPHYLRWYHSDFINAICIQRRNAVCLLWYAQFGAHKVRLNAWPFQIIQSGLNN